MPFWLYLLSGIFFQSDWCYCAVHLILYPNQNPFTGSCFVLIQSPPVPCGTGSVHHRHDLHCYYGFVRLLISHWSGFPIRLYLAYLVSFSLNPLTQKCVGFVSSFKEDVMRPPSVTQESILNHPYRNHLSVHILLKLPSIRGMSHRTEATFGSHIV